MPLLNGPARASIDPADAATFSGTPSPVTLDGTVVLYRFLGTKVDATTNRKFRNHALGAFSARSPRGRPGRPRARPAPRRRCG